MTDDQIRALALEAVAIARRLHVDMERLGEILFVECQEFDQPQGDKEKWRKRTLFDDCYFGFDENTDHEVFDEKDDDLWGWGLSWGNAAFLDALPPLPIEDELQQVLKDEGAA